ncbi:SdrD B-like domain-containing protein [Lentzea sp. HUAS TT2]|uniref:SdrD B-like domain-containing protein n=1 Tax=Lentzea sp. HUAS TT2 TaxID=3447454 RepID=UPI003F72F140
MRAATVLAATSLVALSGTAFAQNENRLTGQIGGSVFNDLNGDGVKQDGEAGINGVDVVVTGQDGKAATYRTDDHGTWNVKHVPSGVYEVGYVDPKLGNTTPTSVKVDVTDGSENVVSFGLRGASICGVAWKDANEDGKRQESEGTVAGRLMYLVGPLVPVVETKVDGAYCFSGLAPGEYRLSSSFRGTDQMALIKQSSDSKFDWVSGLSQSIKLGKGEQVKGIDSGYMTLHDDKKAVQLLIKRDGQATPQSDFRVGDVIEIYGSGTADGNAPQSVSGVLTLPEGLRVQAVLTENAHVLGQDVHMGNGAKFEVGVVEVLGVRVVVDAEFVAGEIKWAMVPDSDPSDNVLTRKITALSAQPHGPAPKPVAAKTATLANTGVDPVAAGAIGLGALALGGLALFGARRRQKA